MCQNYIIFLRHFKDIAFTGVKLSGCQVDNDGQILTLTASFPDWQSLGLFVNSEQIES